MEETAMVEPTTGEQLRALQRSEASARLGILEGMGLDPSARRAFNEGGRICFDGTVDSVFGPVRLKCLMQEDFPASRADEPLMRQVRAFEEKFGALVFFATHEFLPFIPKFSHRRHIRWIPWLCRRAAGVSRNNAPMESRRICLRQEKGAVP